MKISVAEARRYFEHPSQQVYGLTPDMLPDRGVEYYADGDFCGAAHMGPLPGVFFVHMAVAEAGKSRMRRTIRSGRKCLLEFWESYSPVGVIGWTPATLKQAIRMNRLMGFTDRGEIVPGVVEQVWRP